MRFIAFILHLLIRISFSTTIYCGDDTTIPLPKFLLFYQLNLDKHTLIDRFIVEDPDTVPPYTQDGKYRKVSYVNLNILSNRSRIGCRKKISPGMIN